ncbi:MAG: UDP-N-acetylmuramate--L-alanine ligase [Micrococcaceae bacterium]
MREVDNKFQGPFHLIAIGGAGMAPIARNILARGEKVSGSDMTDSDNFHKLEKQGAKVTLGHDAKNLGDAKTVIVSSAIKPENPELKAAKAAGLRVIHRSDALAYLVNNSRAVCVVGTHGKTSTSALTAVAFEAGGKNPGHAIGAAVQDLENVESKQSEFFVAEADESDGSFLKYYPEIAIVTNVEADHLDYYGTEKAVFKAFAKFISSVQENKGKVIICADDAGNQRLMLNHTEKFIRYGFQDADVIIKEFDIKNGKSVFTLATKHPDLEVLDNQDFIVNLPGKHNAYNATAALIASALVDADIEKIKTALENFGGAARRFDFKGKINGISVYDDYAHHPTEVSSAVKAAKEVAHDNAVRVIFQPHLYSRTRNFAKEFAESLDTADTVIVLDVFGARETRFDNISGETITQHSDKAEFVVDKQEAVNKLAKTAKSGDVLMTIGAGDVTALGKDILEALKELDG